MELTGAEAYIVPALKFVMLGVMAGGAVFVFRELIDMARGRTPAGPPAADKEQS